MNDFLEGTPEEHRQKLEESTEGEPLGPNTIAMRMLCWHVGRFLEAVPTQIIICVLVLTNGILLALQADDLIEGDAMTALHVTFTILFNLEVTAKIFAFGFSIPLRLVQPYRLCLRRNSGRV